MTAAPAGFWRSRVTGQDNHSTDAVKVLTIAVIIVICVIEIFNVLWRGAAFEIAPFALANGGLITNLAGAVRLKHGTEPGDTPK